MLREMIREGLRWETILGGIVSAGLLWIGWIATP